MAEPRKRRSSHPESPGVTGAIKDAVEAVAKFVAPKSVTQRRSKINQAVDTASGDWDDGYHGRIREGQSTDSNNR